MPRRKFFMVAVMVALFLAGIIPWTAVAAPESQTSLEQTFQRAKKDYLEKNMNAAAWQIRKSASYMKAQAAKASEKGKEALNNSAKELEKLAEDVKSGAVTSEKRMEETFARAYVALAVDAHIRSTESWARKQKAKTGNALASANKYLERGFAWANQKIETGTEETIKRSKALSRKLKKTGSVMAEDVGKGLKDAGNEIEKFGEKISPGGVGEGSQDAVK
jgi:hypothetical protein